MPRAEFTKISPVGILEEKRVKKNRAEIIELWEIFTYEQCNKVLENKNKLQITHGVDTLPMLTSPI